MMSVSWSASTTTPVFQDDFPIRSASLPSSSKCPLVQWHSNSYQQFWDRVESHSLPDKISFFLVGIDSEDFIANFLSENPEYKIDKDNGSWEFGHSYYLSKPE